MKKFLKVLGIIVLILLGIAIFVYLFVLQYPKLKENPKIGKWYKITNEEMKSADGSQYKAFLKKVVKIKFLFILLVVVLI